MLLAVYFADTNRSYDFKLDANTPVGQLVEDMVGQIAQRDHLTLKRNPGLFLLCSKNNGMIFAEASTLSQNGVHSGDELLLV